MVTHSLLITDPIWKRPFDLTLGVAATLMLAPLAALIAAAIWLESGRPIFYVQDRVGQGGRMFRIWKFRSMVPDAEALSGPVAATETDPRVTAVGRLLRSTALDELPNLINILKGDMSFVGPRPDRPWEVEKNDGDVLTRAGVEASEASLYTLIPNYDRRLCVRPGLAGLAQAYGSYDTPRRQKLRLDLLYTRNISIWLDVKLIVLSLWLSVRGRCESRHVKS